MSIAVKRIVKSTLLNETDLIEVRLRSKELASLCGLTVQDQTRLITAVSEIARDVLTQTTGGQIEFAIGGPPEAQYLQVTFLDRGASVDLETKSDVGNAFGYVAGLNVVKRLVDEIETESGKRGKTIILKKLIPRFVSVAQVTQWQQSMQQLAPNTVLLELQEQNRQLVTALDQIQKVQTELEERTKQLQQANELKAQFLASVSHEIRTPMGAILGLANMLSKRTKDVEDRRLLRLLHESASSLLLMINDLLDMSKIDEGKLAIELVDFSLKDLLCNTVEIFFNEAEQKKITLSAHCTGDVPYKLIGDMNRIRQILINLIGNALKFSDQGAIEVSASVAWSRDDRVGISVAVSDQGIGIRDEDLDNLFEPFSQLKDASMRKVGGTGLGLSICKRLVELLGGKIGVTSWRGKGSTFYFELPLTVRPDVFEPASASPVSVQPLPKFPGKRILLAEDHLVNQIVACDYLEEFEVEVKVVNNGLEVLQALQERQYDLILMDCQMPEMDGFEATAAVRDIENETGRRIPIVAVTANAMAGDRELCLNHGMDDYLSKPYDLATLHVVLTKWLQDEEKAHSKIIDAEALLRRFKLEQARRLVKTFIDDTETRLVKIHDAFESSNLKFIAHEAHALKGASSLISMHEIKETCSELQISCEQGDAKRSKIYIDKLQSLTQMIKVEAADLQLLD